MFCPECGKLNPDDSRFCEQCGAALIDNSAEQMQQPAVQTVPTQDQTNGQQAKPDVVLNVPNVDSAKVKNFIAKKKAILIPVVAVVVALIAFVSIGSSVSAPEKVVEKYFAALTENDFDTMYNQLALPESDFITEESFIKHMETYWLQEGNPYEGITNFIVKEAASDYYDDFDDYYEFYEYGNRYEESNNKREEQTPIKYYNVQIINKSTGETRNFPVTLIEQDSKKLLFFKNYKISSAEYIAENTLIYLEGGNADIAVDGIKLTPTETTDYGYTSYTIPTLFKGEHAISISTDIYEPYEDTFLVQYSNDDFDYSISNMRLKEEIVTTLETTAFEYLKALYSNAMGQNAFPAESFVTVSDYDLKYVYDTLVDRVAIRDDGTGLNSVTFTAASIQTDYDGEKVCYVNVDENGRTSVSFRLLIEYDYKYTRDVGWFSSQIKEYETSSNRSVTFQFTNVDGTWALSEIDNCFIY